MTGTVRETRSNLTRHPWDSLGGEDCLEAEESRQGYRNALSPGNSSPSPDEGTAPSAVYAIFTEYPWEVYEEGEGLGDAESELLVSLQKVEFSKMRPGFFKVAPNVFFSELVYLLYITKPAVSQEFERAREKVKHVLLSALGEKRDELMEMRLSGGMDGAGDEGRKVELLDRAISILMVEGGGPG